MLVIKNSIFSNTEEPFSMTIDVVYDVECFEEEIFSSISSIKPILRNNRTIDKFVFNDYEIFVINILATLEHFFEIVELEESPRSESSHYARMYAKDKDGNIATKILIRLGISDHFQREEQNKRQEVKYVDTKAQEYKRPKEKEHQVWRLKEILVNNETNFSYEEAEESVLAIYETYSKHLYNIGD